MACLSPVESSHSLLNSLLFSGLTGLQCGGGKSLIPYFPSESGIISKRLSYLRRSNRVCHTIVYIPTIPFHLLDFYHTSFGLILIINYLISCLSHTVINFALESAE